MGQRGGCCQWMLASVPQPSGGGPGHVARTVCVWNHVWIYTLFLYDCFESLTKKLTPKKEGIVKVHTGLVVFFQNSFIVNSWRNDSSFLPHCSCNISLLSLHTFNHRPRSLTTWPQAASVSLPGPADVLWPVLHWRWHVASPVGGWFVAVSGAVFRYRSSLHKQTVLIRTGGVSAEHVGSCASKKKTHYCICLLHRWFSFRASIDRPRVCVCVRCNDEL